MAIRDEIIRLLLKTEGADQVAALDKRIEQLGESGQDAARELTRLTDSLGKSQELQSAVDRYRQLARSYIDYSRAIKDGQADLSRMAAAQRTSAAALEGQRAELAEAREELARLNDSSQRYIGTEAERARAIELTKLKVDTLARSVKEAEQAERDNARALESGRTELERTAAAQQRLLEPLNQLKGELESAGLSTTRLGTATKELQAQATAARAGIDALAESVDEQGRAAEAAEAATERINAAWDKLGRDSAVQSVDEQIKELRDAYDTLANSGEVSADVLARAHSRMEAQIGALVRGSQAYTAASDDAARAVQRINDAHATLGTRPFEEIEREIQETRDAYDTLARSGTLSGQALAQANARMVERIRELRSETNGWTQSLDRVKTSLAVAAAGLYGIGRALGVAATASSGFRTSIAQINTLLDDDSAIPQVIEDVRALAKEFGGPAKDQAQAFYDVLSAGYEDAADAATVLNTSNKLAIGGVTDLGVATNGVVSVLKAYGLAADQATRVSDAYFVAAKGGATSIAELATELGKVAPLASQAKIPIETLTAAIAALTNGGVATSDAVTQVSSILTALIKPTKEAKEMAASLGLEFDLAAVRSKGLAGFLKDVTAAAGGNEEALGTLFGRVEAIRGVLSLTGSAAGDLTKILGDMDDAAGATERAYAKLKDTPAAQMARFRAALEGVQIASGDVVIAFIPLVEAASSIARGFSALPDAVQSGIVAFAALSAISVALVRAFTVLRPAIMLLAASLSGPLIAGARAGMAALVALRAAMLAIPGVLAISIAVTGIAAATGLIEGLAEKVAAAADSSGAARESVQQLAEEFRAASRHSESAAEQLRSYANVAMLTAADVARLSEEERVGYETRLQGLQAYTRAQFDSLRYRAIAGDAAKGEREQLEQLEQTLKDVGAAFDAVGTATAATAEAAAKKLTPAAIILEREIRATATSASDAEKKLKELFAGLDLTNTAKVGELALALQSVAERGGQAGKLIREGLRAELEKLSGEDLLRFQEAATTAFAGVGRSGQLTAAVLDQTLRVALDGLGVDAARAGEKITEAGKNTIATFTAIATNARASAQQINEAFTQALSLATTTAEAEALGKALETAAKQGRIGLADAERAANALKTRIAEINVALNPLADSFARLGIESKAQLDATRDAARLAFEEIVRGAREGKAAQDDVRAAFVAYAQTVVASVANSTASVRSLTISQLESRAAALGLSEVLVQAGIAGADAGGKVASAFGDAKATIDDTASSIAGLRDAATDASEGLAQVAAEARNANFSAYSVGIGYMTDLAAAAVGAARGHQAISLAIAQYRDQIFATREELEAYIRTQEEAAEAAQRATDELVQMRNRLRDAADLAAGDEAAIEERRYQEELRRIAELEEQSGQSARREAAEVRRLAEEEHRRRLAEIRDQARARREAEQSAAGGEPREAPRRARPAGGGGDSGGSRPFNAVIQIYPGPLSNEDQMRAVARQIWQEIQHIQRRQGLL